MSRSRLSVWRNAVRDSDLDRTAKLVAHTISTYMNARCGAYPGVDTIAAGASVSDRAVQMATARLEQAGYLELERSRGGPRSTHYYAATMPVTANAVHLSEWDTARAKEAKTANGKPSTVNGTPTTPNGVHPKAFNALKAARLRGLSANAEAASAKKVCPDCQVAGAHAEDCPSAAVIA